MCSDNWRHRIINDHVLTPSWFNALILILICFSSKYQEVFVDPPELRADISFLRDSSNYYYIEVTAMVGQNESKAAPPDGLSFSYDKDALTTMKCE